MKSIRALLTHRLFASQLVVLAALVAGVWSLVSRILQEEFDRRLEDRARVFATLLSQRGPRVELAFSDELMPDYVRPEEPDFFQIDVLGAGVLERSISLHRLDATLQGPAAVSEAPAFWSAVLPDGRSGRLAGILVPVHEYEQRDARGRASERRTARILVGTSDAPLERELQRLRVGLVAIAGAALALSWTLARGSVRTGLASLGELENALARVDGPTRTAPLMAFVAPRELAAVRSALLEMMERLCETFERERRLSSNIAHELRTPIAELRTVSEIALQPPRSVAGLESAVGQARDIAGEMNDVVDTLLCVWRESSAGGESGNGLEVDLVALAARQAQRLSRRASERSMSIVGSAPAVPRRVPIDPRHASLVLGVLFENAVEHGESGSEVRWTVEGDGAAAVFEIRNRLVGGGSEREEPDGGLHAPTRHTGLGLPLARSVCEAHGLELELAAEADAFVARVRVAGRPAAP